jgi:Family of unknown function (DUF6412)
VNAFQAAVVSLASLPAGLIAGSPGLGVLAACGVAGVAVLVFTWMLGRLVGAASIEPPSGRRRQPSAPAFVRLRDPGTAGRPRPRAPSESPALA